MEKIETGTEALRGDFLTKLEKFAMRKRLNRVKRSVKNGQVKMKRWRG
jgi:uncharacterized Zn finger protein